MSNKRWNVFQNYVYVRQCKIEEISKKTMKIQHRRIKLKISKLWKLKKERKINE